MSSTNPGRKEATRLPARTRDRRPALAALAILLILLGALGSALIAYRTGDRVEVLVAARDIDPGTQVQREDFRVVRIASDGAAVIDSTAVDNFVGTYATGRVPEGTLVNNQMFTVTGVLPEGAQLVGVTAPVPQRPSEELRTGDVVAVYRVENEGVGGTEVEGPRAAELIVPAARVVHLSDTVGGDVRHLTLMLADGTVPAVVQINASGQLALTRLPDTVQPPVDQPTSGQ